MYKDVICERVHLCKLDNYPLMIHEFENSYFVLGEHQYYEGYSLLYLKEHYRELHEMPQKMYIELSAELYMASTIIEKTFQPLKLNVMSIGNLTPHIHWHIIPRYKEDTHSMELPMYQFIKGEDDIEKYSVSERESDTLIKKIRENI